MTELLQPTVLREMARMISTQAPQPSRTVLLLQWSIDEATQRPICQWKREPKSAAID